MTFENKTLTRYIFVGFGVLFLLAFIKVHLGVQSTIVGYRLGQLKAQEAEVLAHRSQLQMQLAKLSTREHLSMLASSQGESKRIATMAAVTIN